VVIVEPPPFKVDFFMGSTKITAQNTNDSGVGLFPGQKGGLGITKRDGNFAGETFTITFYYYRPDKPGMNLNALLTFDPSPDGDLTLLNDINKEDTTTFVDGLRFRVKKTGTAEVKLPFTVRPDAAKSYPVDGNVHGYFNLRLSEESNPFAKELRFYREGAWLREGPP
jgi:hypothetical protein